MLSYDYKGNRLKVVLIDFVIVCKSLLNPSKLLLLFNLWEINISDKVVQYPFSIRGERVFPKFNHSVFSFSKINGVKL